MRKDVIVKQEGYKECGASCLLSIIKYYGGNISIDKLLKLTNTNHLGTNFYNIKVAANEIGLNAKGYNIKIDGVFGSKSVVALKKYQKAKGLTVDGVCGYFCHR